MSQKEIIISFFFSFSLNPPRIDYMKNVKVIYTIMLALFLSACAKEKVTQIDPGFEVFASRFEQEARKQGVGITVDNLKISFDDNEKLGSNILGVCKSGLNFIPEIVISRSYWTNMSLADKEQLMFHEMGHCVLGRGHNSRVVNGYAASIMNPYHIGSIYSYNYTSYMSELFLGVSPTAISYYGVNQFPAGAYASTIQASTIEYKAMKKETAEGEEFNLEHFGCVHEGEEETL